MEGLEGCFGNLVGDGVGKRTTEEWRKNSGMCFLSLECSQSAVMNNDRGRQTDIYKGSKEAGKHPNVPLRRIISWAGDCP